jgi:hypothetical protein
VFELVPPEFDVLAGEFYAQMNQPPIMRTNVWNIYLELLGCFEHLDNLHRSSAHIDVVWGYCLDLADSNCSGDNIELLPEFSPLQERDGYRGGVNNGLGLGNLRQFCGGALPNSLTDPAQRAHVDAMVDRDDPLPRGVVDIIEAPVVQFSDDEDEWVIQTMSLAGG